MKWLTDLFHLFYPSSCVVCGGRMSRAEKHICIHCMQELPRTYYHLQPDNEMARRFWGKNPLVERAAAFFHYNKESEYRKIIYTLKYNDLPGIGKILGCRAAEEALSSGFFKGIDVIIPVPLHKTKYRKRGYNQSEWIGKGIAEVTHIPVCTGNLIRLSASSTQTHKSLFERKKVEGDFRVRDPQALSGKHVLLIDDVMTTGSTVLSCMEAMNKVPHIKLSLFTLGVVR